jgi:exopolysaccharide biosynthesis polyprenyl glycosylphosphotransferase
MLTDLQNRPRSGRRQASGQVAFEGVRRRRWLIGAGESLIVAMLFIFDVSRSSSLLDATFGGVFLAAVWLLAVHVFRRQFAHLEAMGQRVIDILAAVLATAVLAAVTSAWSFGALHILVLGFAAGVVTTLWNWLASRRWNDQRRVLIVGGWADGVGELLTMLESAPRARVVPVGIIVEEHGEDYSLFGDVPVLGTFADIQRVVDEQRPGLIVVGVQRNRPEVFAELLEVAGAGFRVVGLPEFYEHVFGLLPVRQLTAAWFMSILHLYQRPYSANANRVFDLIIASLIVIAFLPLFPLTFLLIAFTPGAVIYRQTRIGENGRPFTIYKFRTMTPEAEEAGALWAEEGDVRVTGLGRVFRRLRMDELPQIANVFKGEMSIVGPRPERPEFVELLEAEVPFWSRRHLIKPGITGWAQIRGGYASGSSETEEKLAYDLWYLRHRSVLVDLIICLMTFPRILTGHGAR